ncbi:MAG TPA: hypothetical protein VE778_06155 [Candidatus Bathyarchaeia archaeon]|jgi:hypothetical protein|nr:hypothetical protein [Candidatus Bathyarchaeia archaeon]
MKHEQVPPQRLRLVKQPDVLGPVKSNRAKLRRVAEVGVGRVLAYLRTCESPCDIASVKRGTKCPMRIVRKAVVIAKKEGWLAESSRPARFLVRVKGDEDQWQT